MSGPIITGTDYNYFNRLTVANINFNNKSDVVFPFRGNPSFSIVNEGTDTIQYSFNGITIHGDLVPGTVSASLIANKRSISQIWFRAKNGIATNVRVEACADGLFSGGSGAGGGSVTGSVSITPTVNKELTDLFPDGYQTSLYSNTDRSLWVSSADLKAAKHMVFGSTATAGQLAYTPGTPIDFRLLTATGYNDVSGSNPGLGSPTTIEFFVNCDITVTQIYSVGGLFTVTGPVFVETILNIAINTLNLPLSLPPDSNGRFFRAYWGK
jgi:hypothetical protein